MNSNQEINIYRSELFNKTGLVKQGFTGRRGGFSSGNYSSLNLSIFTADEPNRVRKNRQKLCQVLNFNEEAIVQAQQVHGTRIERVSKVPRQLLVADALITSQKGLVLMAYFADCLPLFFLDPFKKVIALVHAGWRGTVGKLTTKTIKVLVEEYQCSPEDLLVDCGPHIGVCHYQVGLEVISQVEKAFPQDVPLLLNKCKTGKAYFDLAQANVIQLLKSGVLRENISLAGLCTFCHSQDFFSHRRGALGRQAAFLELL